MQEAMLHAWICIFFFSLKSWINHTDWKIVCNCQIMEQIRAWASAKIRSFLNMWLKVIRVAGKVKYSRVVDVVHSKLNFLQNIL